MYLYTIIVHDNAVAARCIRTYILKKTVGVFPDRPRPRLVLLFLPLPFRSLLVCPSWFRSRGTSMYVLFTL